LPEKTDCNYELRSRGRAILGFEALDTDRCNELQRNKEEVRETYFWGNI
jgi:hypothetical protein